MKKTILLLLLATNLHAGELTAIPANGSNPFFGGKTLTIIATDHRGQTIALCRNCNRLTFTATAPANKQGRITITGTAQGQRSFSMKAKGKIIVNVSPLN